MRLCGPPAAGDRGGGGECACVGSCPLPCSAPPNMSMCSDGLVNGHPGLPSPGQTWSSPANFRNDLWTQLLLSHWRRGRGRTGKSRRGRGCVCGVGRGAPDISPQSLLSGLGGVSVRRPGETPLGRSGSCDLGPAQTRYPSGWVLLWAPCELMGVVFRNVRWGLRWQDSGLSVYFRPFWCYQPARPLFPLLVACLENKSVSWKDFRIKLWGEGTFLRITLDRTWLLLIKKKNICIFLSHEISFTVESQRADGGRVCYFSSVPSDFCLTGCQLMVKKPNSLSSTI